MKIALIADIHGNLPALEAVMADIAIRKADKIFCLGDIIGKGPSSKETIDICRKNCDVVVRGNWDHSLYTSFIDFSHGLTAGIHNRALWFIDDAGAQRMEYLGSLPHYAELYLSGKLIRLFHAHPLNFNRYFSHSSVEQKLELFEYDDAAQNKKQSDVAIYADIHYTYTQAVNGKLLFNIGSVGNPLDITQSSYVILEGNANSEIDSSFNVQFIRVPYDIDKAVMIAKSRNVPDLEGYISELTTAKYFRRA